METSKIEIKDEVLRQGAEEGMDEFIKVFTDKYLEVTGGVINAATIPTFFARLSFFSWRD